jgi:diguanylate cyclase (GGDEF)-like protein/PAS domain S-box-containing protein
MVMTNNNQAGKIARLIFSPAVALLNRMSYTRKFTLLWLMSLIAIAIVVYSLFVSLERVIQPSQRELEGLALIEPISRVVQAVQIHRGVSAALLSGGASMKDRLAAKERDAVAAFAAMDGTLPLPLTSSEDYRQIKADWERLLQEGLRWTADENFDAHTRLIERLQSLRSAIGDDYALTLDGELATFYLIDTNVSRLPQALEHLGQLRAYGTGVLTTKKITERQRIKLNNLIAELDGSLKELRINIDKAGRHNPAIRDSLLGAHGSIADSVRTLTHLVTEDILTGRFATTPEAFLDIATAEIDKGYAQMHESLLPTTRRLIEARIAKAKNTLIASVGGALLLFSLVVYISVSIYYAIVGSIQALVRSAQTFAAGDLKARVKLDTRDEISRIADSFNKMADGLNALLEERKRAESALAESKERFFTIIETALDAVVQMDSDGIITGWNAQAERTFGWPRQEAIGRAMDETIIPHQYREAHVRGLKHFLATGEGAILNSQVEMQAMHRDGHEFPVELSIVPIKMAGKYEFSAFINDITGRKKSEDLIWKQANFDQLTGLPNRHMFYDRLAQETRKADRTGLIVVLLYIDLDRFKEVNDTLGHSMGDILLVDAARRIGACVRETDTVARLGGDEFIIVLTDLNDAGRIDALTQNILHELAEPFRLGSEVAYISASIGITLYPHDAAGMEELVKNADQAMYAAKNAGRNRFSYFTQAMQQTAQTRLKLSNDLHGAVAGRQFEVHYQPIVELATGRIHKAEALIRWRHPVRGLVGPAEFIPVAEESGLILEIGDWVFREAANRVKRWRALYDREFQISVNMSPVQFRGARDPCREWPTYLRELDLPGQSVVIEITEGLLLEAEQGVMDKLLRFHEAGIQISLDDFGTGYSALSYLQKFDIDYLKIDQSFTRNLAPGSSSMALSEAIIMMAHRLGMKVIAEGVETQAQRELLANAGCNYVQGYLFSRPVAAEEFEKLLKRVGV